MNPNIPEDMAEIFDEFLVETTEALSHLDQHFLDLEADPGNTGLLNEIFRTVHSIKGGAGFLELNDLVAVAHGSENVLNTLRNGEIAVTADIIDLVLESVDMIKAILSQVQGEDVGTLDIGGMVQKLDLMLQFALEAAGSAAGRATAPAKPAAPARETAPAEPETSPKAASPAKPAETAQAAPAPPAAAPVPAAAPEPKAAAPAPDKTPDTAAKAAATPKVEAETSIRVDTARLDNVMNLVGELVLCRNRVLKLVSELDARGDSDPALRDLVASSSQLNLVTTDLQLSVMKTRMQPVGKIFQKFPRMVRDMARKLDKQIELEIHGEDTELDKSLLEELGDPLVHLVRNAIDHGIESPEVRRKAGKPAHGTVLLSADYDGAAIVIKITDDGAGIDPQRIKNSVIKKGLMGREQLEGMSEKDIYHLIFLPGLSTKEQVSDISGRGVGMDVVLTNIRKVGGIIDVDSRLGEGTTISLSLPLTIAIIQTMMVSAADRLFAIPLSSIVETLRLEPADIQLVDGHQMVRLRDQILPIAPLAKVFGLPRWEPKAGERFNVIVVALAEKRIGLLVDLLHQQEEVVIKSMGEYLGEVTGIAGATINGEGQVVLILDIGAMIDLLN
ncbi:MAG: chemotaxis protein CheA [Nitrospirae bacterium]|nr:chemotaxis protein CheA [Nitrospirota bacterium]